MRLRSAGDDARYLLPRDELADGAVGKFSRTMKRGRLASTTDRVGRGNGRSPEGQTKKLAPGRA
jgi:hypothetical protein